MPRMLSLLCLVFFLAIAVPAQAQLRVDVPAQRAPARLFGSSSAGVVLNKLFSPEHFRMMHSYEMSMGSFGGSTSSMGMYTNSMMWQFNDKLAARVDLSYAHSLFGGNGGMAQKAFGMQNDQGRFFLQNAEIAYRPSERVLLHLSVRQSPYGAYMGPYGYHNPYMFGYDVGGMRHADDLFWRGRAR